MRKVLGTWAVVWGLLVAGVFCVSQVDHVSAFWQTRDSNYNNAGLGAPAVASGCSQATAYLSAASDITNSADKTNFTTFICGGVTDGWFAKYDGIYMNANVTEAASEINLVAPSGSYNLTKHGATTFTAYTGVASNGTTGYYDTGFDQSTAGGNMSQNSVTFGFCTTALSVAGGTPLGATDGTNFLEIAVSADTVPYINDGTGFTYVGLPGFYQAVRTGLSTTVLYLNGSSVATGTATSTGVANRNMYLLARNDGGTADDITTSAQQFSIFAFGGKITATDATNFQTRLNTFLTTGNWNVTGC